MSNSRARADVLHRADTIRRLLNRWSRKGFFRRPVLGQIIQLEQIVSYNVYFYELRTLYEVRTPPEKRQRRQRPEDQPSTPAPPGLWEVDVPEPENGLFIEVKPHELMLPDSTAMFDCPVCGGEGHTPCSTCNETGMVERTHKVQDEAGNITYEATPQQCPTCHGYGKLRCSTCDGMGNLVEEEVFIWSRRARLWQNTDDIEGLPRLALDQRARPVCSTFIDPYEGYWHSVAPLDELLQAAIDEVQDANTRIIAAELQISGVPITEIDYHLDNKAQRLYLVGHDSLIIGDWALLNSERIALVIISSVLLFALLLFVVMVLL
jgi:predicted RNA-binding Zn-ribbon protein involved in translation (DUF1610 family)